MHSLASATGAVPIVVERADERAFDGSSDAEVTHVLKARRCAVLRCAKPRTGESPMLRTSIVAVCLLASAVAFAADAPAPARNPVALDRTAAAGPHGDSAASVSAYAPNAASRGTSAADDPMGFGFGGVGKQENASGKKAGCVYKGVMTDDEIAACKAISTRSAARTSRKPRR